MPNSSKKYKHQIYSNILVEAITAEEDVFIKKAETYNKIGIQRKSLENYSYINSDFPIGTVISNAVISKKGIKVIINGLENQKIYPIVFDNCKLFQLELRGIKSGYHHTSIYFYSCNIASVSLDDCNIRSVIFGQETVAEKILLDNGSETQRILFKDKSKAGLAWIYRGSEVSNIVLNGESRVKEIRLFESEVHTIQLNDFSKSGAIRFYMYSKSSIFLNGNSKTNSIELFQKSKGGIKIDRKSEVGEIQLLDESELKFIKVLRESQVNDIVLDEQSKAGIILLSEKAKAREIRLLGKSEVADFFFLNTSINSLNAQQSIFSITIIDSSVSNILFQDCQIMSFRFQGKSKTEAFIKNSLINLLDLKQTVIYNEASIIFNSVKFYACLLDELTVFGILFFRDISALQTPFPLPEYVSEEAENKYVNKELRTMTSTEQSVFRINYSSLGQTEFLNSNFESFDRFEFSHSQIKETFISRVKVPNKIFIRVNNKSEKQERWEIEEQKVSFYNQLSRVFSNQGFIYNAVKFRTRSAQHQQNILWEKIKGQNDNQNGNSDMKLKIFLDYLPFFLNRWSNKHGESWGRALLFILGTSALLYLSYLYSMQFPADPFKNSFLENLGYYFEFINPFRPFDFMEDAGYKMNALTRFIDLISRLVIGYGVFQFLSAFRKYKKE